MDSLEQASPEQLRAHQWTRLQAVLTVTRERNPFYRRKWGDAACQSWEDFGRLPLTTKGELVADQEAHPPFGSNLAEPLEAFVRVHQTSGTTGRPLRWLDTTESWAWWRRCWNVVYEAAGVTPADRVFFPFSFGPFIGFWSAFDAARDAGVLAISGGGQTTEERIQLLLELGASALVCTPTYALRLASVARQMGVALNQGPLRLGIFAGEPGAQVAATRQHIQDQLGVEVFDHTGMCEVGATGFECQAHPGGTHLNEAEFVFEVLDPHTQQPADDGELVVTNLGRSAMPVIRYRTGDRVRWTRAPCGCGRTFARLEGGIRGRVDDMLTVRGVNVFPSALENIVRRHSTEEFRFLLFQRDGLDELILEMELDAAGGPHLTERVGADLHRHLGLRIEVRPLAPGTLPRAELKARRVVRSG
jgi:phenylacetate-CoA ligase